MLMSRPTLAEPLVLSEWWKNRGGESIRLTILTYGNRNVVDLRTWYSAEGTLKPGKGFCAEAKHLPKLASAFAEACSRARELHLIDADEEGEQ
jgi:hypothetical protein